VVIDVTSVDVVSLLSDVEGRADVVLVASGDVDEVEVLEEVVLVQYVVVENVLVSDASVSNPVQQLVYFISIVSECDESQPE
jgi:phosphoketolase